VSVAEKRRTTQGEEVTVMFGLGLPEVIVILVFVLAPVVIVLTAVWVSQRSDARRRGRR